MKKLGNIEKPKEFVSAILKGADVNQMKNGVPIINFYFNKAMRFCSKSKFQQDYYNKVVYLLSAGADAKSLIENPVYFNNASIYKHLIGETLIHLELLNLLLNSQSAKDAIIENQLYWENKAESLNYSKEPPTDSSYHEDLYEDITEEEMNITIELEKAALERERRKIRKEQNSYLKPLLEITDLLKGMDRTVNEMFITYNNEL